ncbi:MIT domain-containing protein [Botrytis cinerea]
MPSLSYSATTEDRLPYPLPTNNSVSNSRSNNSSANSTLNAPVNRLQRKPSGIATTAEATHSRSSSTSGAQELSGNFNRWSQSTTSSAGGHIRSRSNSNSRLSFGGSGLNGNGVGQSPPRKLQKSRPSIDNSPQTRRPTDRPANPPLPSSLPPIITLPIDQQPGNNSPSLSSALTPSTAGLLSAAVHQTVPDYFGKSWEGSRPRDISQRRSPSRSGNHSISPSPISTFSAEAATRRRLSGEGAGVPRAIQEIVQGPKRKANTAVLLDNAQNYEGAMQAYSEACNLLQQVMARSSGDEDRRKLEAIRNTYTSRINELAKITPELSDEKALPARPESTDFRSEYRPDELPMSDEEEEPAIIETATITRIVNDASYPDEPRRDRSYSRNRQSHSRGESSLPSTFEPSQGQTRNHPDQRSNYFSRYNQSQGRNVETSLAVPMESQYMPPPLSPRRPVSPMTYGPSSSGHRRQKSSESPSPKSNTNLSAPAPSKGHTRAPSNESMSWLDTIDESGGSAASSVHSRSSSLNVRRKHIRASSGQTEAEFDAALDAAVEAAYDDGFEPVNYDDDDDDDELVASVRRKIELAKERVRQNEREAAIEDAHERERKRLFQQMQEPHIGPLDDYEGNESEEEERMLEEMTRGYVMDDFEFGLQSKSALPRESDSSGSFSGRTWHSSSGSIPPLTNIAAAPAALPQPQIQPPHPPPSQALPAPPTLDGSPVRKSSPAQSVRSRRLSGQNAKQLKIETSSRLIEVQNAPLTLPPSIPPPQIPDGFAGPKTAGLLQHGLGSIGLRTAIPTRQGSISGPSSSDYTSPPTAFLTQTLTNDSNDNFNIIPRSGSPNRSHSRAGLRKNFSSSSLKNVRSHTMNHINGRMPAMPTLPTPIAAAFKEKMNGAPTGGLYLFNNDLHSPESPGSPNLMSAGAPIPLEPCPTEYLLRPFWLMRALYQTIAHPRGGYLSTKLFIPRDVWRVKGVKIKGVEDKIASCDFLTAALMKLGQVDTCDADAVLEEMQALEGVLEQVQITLSKKLGSEVGVHGSNGMFKDATMGDPMDFASTSTKSGNTSSKTSSFSWRRLRSKNSAMGLSNNYSNKVTSPEIPKEGLTMGTLPMTSAPRSRFAKRDVSQVQFSGPNANYMSALARLFDAAQAIDQIARQVEDPGLRHADKTQVGLELCTRHAAEFFGFYICRFVLNDISMLLDKFIKRGSEWVLV